MSSDQLLPFIHASCLQLMHAQQESPIVADS